MPPFNFGELAFLLFIPLFFWIYSEPDWKALLRVGLFSSFFCLVGNFYLVAPCYLCRYAHLGFVPESLHLTLAGLCSLAIASDSRSCLSSTLVWVFGDSGVLGALRVPPLILNLWNADGPFSLNSVAKTSAIASIGLDWALRIIFLFDLF